MQAARDVLTTGQQEGSAARERETWISAMDKCGCVRPVHCDLKWPLSPHVGHVGPRLCCGFGRSTRMIAGCGQLMVVPGNLNFKSS